MNRASASMNPTLTTYAQGLVVNLNSALAEFLAPTVLVPATIGNFKKYDDHNAFQNVDTLRGLGGPARRLDFEATSPSYNCKPNALEATMDDAERDAEGNATQRAQEMKVAALVSSAIVSHEVKVLAAITSAVAAVAGRGAFSSPDIDPIDQIDEQIATIANATGMLPNRIVLGLGAWRILRGNAKVKARLSGVKTGGFTLEDFAGTLLNPSIEARVGVLVKSTTKMPKTDAKSNIVGDEVFIYYASPSPTVYDASFAKTFKGGRGGVDAVRMYRDEQCRSDVMALDWSVDVQVVSTALVKRLSIT
jgi:hypothetical protein